MQFIKMEFCNREIDKNQEKWQNISQNIEINQEFVSTKYWLKYNGKSHQNTLYQLLLNFLTFFRFRLVN